MRRKPSFSAICCIFEPGSVIATKRLPASFAPTIRVTRSKKYCLKMFGSRVLPDLLETMNSVLARSTLLSNDLIVASGLSATGVHKLDSAYAGVSFSSWAFWTVGAAAELSSGQYLLTGPSGLARLNPNTGGFAFLTTPGGVQPELFAAFDPLAVCSGGVAYCTSGTTSSGCVPLMNGSGGPSATALSGFTLGVTQLEGQKQGLIFYGVSGRALAAWGSSFLCVKSPTQRMSVLNSGGTAGACDGLLSEDWNAFMTAHPGALGSPRSAGQALQAQGWFRDPPSPKTTNLSNALETVLCP